MESIPKSFKVEHENTSPRDATLDFFETEGDVLGICVFVVHCSYIANKRKIGFLKSGVW